MSYSTMKRTLEIELISAEGLKINRKPVKKNTYCVVKIDQKSQVSKLDDLGGNHPIWKDKFKMEMLINDLSVSFILIEVFCKTSGGLHKSIGVAKIPTTDFFGGFSPRGHLNLLSYRLRDQYGDKSGIVNVSIMVKPDGSDVKFYPAPAKISSSLYGVAPVGYTACSSQAANGQMWRPKTYSPMSAYGGSVVTGVPVWCAYQRPS